MNQFCIELTANRREQTNSRCIHEEGCFLFRLCLINRCVSCAVNTKGRLMPLKEFN